MSEPPTKILPGNQPVAYLDGEPVGWCAVEPRADAWFVEVGRHTAVMRLDFRR